MYWYYFNVVWLESGDVFKLVSDEGITLKNGQGVVLFASIEEAEDYLEEHNVRGSIR